MIQNGRSEPKEEKKSKESNKDMSKSKQMLTLENNSTLLS